MEHGHESELGNDFTKDDIDHHFMSYYYPDLSSCRCHSSIQQYWVWHTCMCQVPRLCEIRTCHIYIYVWKLNQTVLELDFWAVKFCSSLDGIWTHTINTLQHQSFSLMSSALDPSTTSGPYKWSFNSRSVTQKISTCSLTHDVSSFIEDDNINSINLVSQVTLRSSGTNILYGCHLLRCLYNILYFLWLYNEFFIILCNILKQIAELDCCQIMILTIYVPSIHA
jgi:hypothetical protein